MPRTHFITIKRGFRDGSLDLSDHDYTEAVRTDFIIWNIRAGANVNSIDRIVLKDSSPDIFLRPPEANGRIWTASIRHNAPMSSECDYTIHWTGTWGPKEYDPKIAVRPTLEIKLIKPLIGGLILGLVGLLSISLWGKKRD